MSGKGAHLHIKSADALKEEFDPNGAHEPIKELPDDMKKRLVELGYTEKQVLNFETMSAEQLVHMFDEATTVVQKALKVRGASERVLEG